MLKKRLFQICVELTNGKYSSKMIQKLTKSNASRLLIQPFISVYKINTYEILKDVSEFKNLNEFFIREVHPSLRPISEKENDIVSPTDGVVSEVGTIEDDATFIVKGQEYSVKTLIGDKERAKELAGGTYMVIYLSPKNYHRIHFPTDAKVLDAYTIGKYSYPVNKAGLELGDNVLSYNYRQIFTLYNNGLKYNLIPVGAQNVNSIVTTYSSDEVKKGSELGYFEFGSTVVLLFEKDSIELANLELPLEIKMGQTIAEIKNYEDK
ncbi:phosphatidylserine decarboxylase [Gemella sp. GH3]|uniref:phosphatidylserine decarboxylase n=1 Tax=unclassified Gemella TaxID=2624949 RepID=UPI0015CFCB2D|nr:MULTISPECIES: phosphatidylserine decarboxylase [unclassified Gemella]MBF0714128.1 phosphatidylserine decarboxylase [Gemella sp. GH3.1]NYS51080.1 phosphatidylserine decarboxylase [Gemella sp. GH3]